MAPKPAPLPVAANHAALSNRISMLLSAQSSLLKTLNPSSGSSAASSSSHKKTQQHKSAHDLEKEDEELFKNNGRPNEGVGYTAPNAGPQSAHDRRREDQALRGKIMGKGAGRNGRDAHVGKGKGRSLPREESESEEEAGRSALGKRKRPRREEASPAKMDGQDETGVEVDDGAGVVEEETKEVEDAEDIPTSTAMPQQGSDPAGGSKRNKKKKKNKNKKKQAASEGS